MMHFLHHSTRGGYQPSGADLWAWFDFSQSASITTQGGGRVTQVADLSGNGRHLTALSGSDIRPFYASRTMNGLPVADFQGGQYLQFPSGQWLGSSNLTLFCVYQNDLAEGAGYLFQARTLSNMNSLRFLSHQALANGSVAFIHNTIGGQLNMVHGRSTAPVLAGIVRKDATMTGYWNNHSAMGVAADFSATGEMVVGARWNGSAWEMQFDGAIAEMVVFTRAVEGSELAALQGYLAAKWGVFL